LFAPALEAPRLAAGKRSYPPMLTWANLSAVWPSRLVGAEDRVDLLAGGQRGAGQGLVEVHVTEALGEAVAVRDELEVHQARLDRGAGLDAGLAGGDGGQGGDGGPGRGEEGGGLGLQGDLEGPLELRPHQPGDHRVAALVGDLAGDVDLAVHRGRGHRGAGDGDQVVAAGSVPSTWSWTETVVLVRSSLDQKNGVTLARPPL
jgi:hypothetical protein